MRQILHGLNYGVLFINLIRRRIITVFKLQCFSEAVICLYQWQSYHILRFLVASCYETLQKTFRGEIYRQQCYKLVFRIIVEGRQIGCGSWRIFILFFIFGLNKLNSLLFQETFYKCAHLIVNANHVIHYSFIEHSTIIYLIVLWCFS